MANIKLKSLITEAEDFQAKSKESGKMVHFKSKDSYQAALKAGTHEDPKAKKGEQPKGNAKPNDMFGGDYSKDRGGKADSMATVNSIATKTGMRAQAVAGWADENGVNLSKVSADIDSKKLKPMDFMTAVSGNPGNKYAKDIIAKYSQSASPKSDMGVDSVVYNKRTKTVGIVRMPDERGETKTDADGNVNTDELEPYNPMKYPHQKDAKAAPSTSKEIDARGLWKPFAQSSNSGDWMDDLDSIDTSDIKGKADPDADSFTSGDLYGATFKDPQTGKPITVGDAYEREDDSEAYKKAFAYVSKFDPDKEAVIGTQAYDDLNKKDSTKLSSMLPKKDKSITDIKVDKQVDVSTISKSILPNLRLADGSGYPDKDAVELKKRLDNGDDGVYTRTSPHGGNIVFKDGTKFEVYRPHDAKKTKSTKIYASKR